LQTLIYWVEFLIVTTILGAPLAIYEGYFRERQYGLATQTFGPWMGEQFEMLLVNMVIGGLAMMVLFGVVAVLRTLGGSRAPSSPWAFWFSWS
jgi:STE24 endopeptidase